VAAIGTGIAAPVALAAGIAIIATSNAFMVGAVAPDTGLGAEAVSQLSVWASTLSKLHIAVIPVSAMLGGFVGGQSFQRTFILTDPAQKGEGCRCPADGDSASQSKTLDLRVAAVDPGTGCSPVSLTQVPLPRARRWLAALLALQALLVGAWLLTRPTRHGGLRP
jgi:hypothetical protein